MDYLNEFFRNIIVLDTETTGVEDDSEIIEYSASFPESANDSFEDVANFTERYNALNGIPPESSAVHFICESDLVDKPYYKDAYKEFYEFFDYKQYYVGHNVEFDRRMLRCNNLRVQDELVPAFEDDSKWICTLKLAKKLYAEDPEFKNLTLSFLWFKFKLNEECTHKIEPHSAKDDVFMCYKVLNRLVQECIKRGAIDPDKEIGSQLVEYSNEPILYKVMPFGKYKNKPLLSDEIPINYLLWFKDNSDLMNPESPAYDVGVEYSILNAILERKDQL